VSRETIRLTNVSFSYGRRARCVNDVSIEIDGASLLLLGANGAGKSTLLRLMAGQLKHSSGSRRVVGSVGYMPQRIPRVPGFTVREQVAYCGWLAGLPTPEARESADEHIELVGISSLVRQRVDTLSGGELARVGIAGALAARARLLLLDEPSAALDPIARRSVLDALARVADTGVAVVATSHTGSDLGRPFERVVLMDRGKIHFDGSRRNFLHGDHDDPAVLAMVSALNATLASGRGDA